MRTLLWMGLVTGCVAGEEKPGETGETGATGETGEVDTGACSSDVDAAIVALNVPDAGYDTAGEQIFTEFTCDLECGGDSAPCFIVPAHCADAGDPTAEYPFDEALAIDTGSLDGYIEGGAKQALAAKLGLVDVKDGMTCAGPSGDRLAEIDAWYQTNRIAPMACQASGTPAPPTGACPSLTSCSAWADVVGTYFTLTMDLALAEGKLNLAQENLNPMATGCWVRAVPTTGDYIWLAALYGKANFGTAALVQFAPCGSTNDADLQVLTVHELGLTTTGVNMADFMLWFDEPQNILSGTMPGSGQIVVESMKFTQALRRYKWEGANGFYERSGGSWVPLGAGVNPPGWPTCATKPFSVGSTPTGPFAIIDPANSTQAEALDIAAGLFGENLTFAGP